MSMIFLLDFYVISMGVLWYLDGFAMASPRDFHDVFTDISLGFLWDFHGVSHGSYRNSTGFSGCLYGTSMAFLWYSCGIFFGFLLDFHEVSLGFLCHF